IYIFKQGINASGNADIVGTDVFIFNTHTNYPGAFRIGVDTCGPINLSGNGTTTVAAMTPAYVAALPLVGGLPPKETNYVNFLVYQDPACTNAMMISGNGDFDGTGTIYIPNAPF